jgi:GNAT superfamily N-acetyltransferase
MPKAGALIDTPNPGKSPVQCRTMQQADLEAVVKVHQAAFPGFFLTRMGRPFLCAYYQAVLDFDASIALIASDENTKAVLGFAVGFSDPQGFYTLFAHRRRRLLPAIVLAVLRDPALVGAILRNMRRVEAQARASVDAVELSSIAVAASGAGVGGVLLEAFATHARDGGAHSLFLTTDANGNDAVQHFYQRRGFTLDGHEDRGDRRLCRYVRTLG